MAAGEIALSLLITAKDNASGVIAGLPGPLGAVGMAGIAAAGAVVGIGVAAVKAAGSFEQLTNTLVTSAGESLSNLDSVRKGILDISVSTATSTQQLSAAMYQIESSGQHGAAGLNVLKVAAQGAKSENADLEVVAKALTTVLTDYHIPAANASQAMNGLIATVSSGKTTLQELSSAMGAVLPIASALHISFPQVAGSIATMTNAGMSAQQASQNLAHVLVALESPSGVATKSMMAVGLSAEQVKNALVNQGLPEALQLIETHVGKVFPEGSVNYETAIKNITGGIVGFKLAAMLTGDSLKTTEGNITKITAAMKDSSGAVAGFDVVQQSFNFKVDQAKAALQALLITLGQQLLPVFGQVIGAVTPLISQFTAWIPSIMGVSSATGNMGSSISQAFSGLAPIFANIGGMLRVMASNWSDLAAASGPTMNALKQFGSLIGQLLPGFISQFLRAASQVNLVLLDIGTAVSQWAVPGFKILGQIVKSTQTALEPILNVIDSQLVPAFHNLVTVVAPLVTAFLQWVASSNIIPTLFAGISAAIQVVVNVLSGLITGVAAIIKFFTQTQVGIAIFQAVIILLGTLVVAIVAVATVIMATMIPAFVAWVAGAVAVGIANVVAFAPIIIAVLAVIAVITLVVLAVKNWGAIAKWLEGVWAATASFFQGVWAGIVRIFQGVGQWFKDRFTEAAAGVSSAWSVVTAFFSSIGQWFHDRFTEAADGISAAWAGVTGFFSGVWKNIQGFFSGVGTWFHDRFVDAGNGIQSAWQNTQNFFGGVGKWFQDRGTDASKGWSSGMSALGQANQTAMTKVADGFKWLYDHNYYFKDLADGIKKWNKDATDWLINAWNVSTHAVVAAWQWLSSGAVALWNTVTTAITKAVTTSIQWIQQQWTIATTWIGTTWHKISGDATLYWTLIYTAISTWITRAIQWVQQQWTTVTTWLGNLWSGISHLATSAWNAVATAISTAIDAAGKAIQAGWTSATTWLVAQWNNLKTFADTAWKQVSTVFGAAWTTYTVKPLTAFWTSFSQWWTTTTTNVVNFTKNLWTQVQKIFSTAWTTYIVQPMTSLWNSLTQWFTTLATNFGTWAGNAMKMFASGITSGAKNALTALSNFGANIAKLLGFHSPPAEGPLAESGQWMPNMMSMFAQGITQGTPKVLTSTTNMATGVNRQMTTLNQQVGQQTTNINSNVQRMGTQFQTSSANMNNSLSTLNTQVKNGTSQINANFTQLGSGLQTNAQNMTQQLQQLQTQVAGSVSGINQSTNQLGSGLQTTTQYFTTFTTTADKSTQQVTQSVSKMQMTVTPNIKDTAQTVQTGTTQISKSGDDMSKNIEKSLSHTGNIFTDFINNFNTMAAQVEKGATKLASDIANVLGHTKPKTGPMRDDDVWGKHFVDNIVGGMQSGIPQLTSTATACADAIRKVWDADHDSFTWAGGSSSGGGPNLNINALASSFLGGASNFASLSAGGVSSGNQPMVINMILDGKQIGKTVTTYQQRELHVQGSVRNR